jgi:phenylacetate-CoA ligase
MHPETQTAYDRNCGQVLQAALDSIPAYSSWRSADPGPYVPILQRYGRLPFTTKDELRQYPPRAFTLPGYDVAAGLKAGTIEMVRTNGTSSEAVETVWWQPWWDASERASWKRNSHTARLPLGDHKEAILGSALSIGRRSDQADLSTSQRRMGRFLYLNEKSTPLLWTQALMDRMLAELAEFEPIVLEANPSYLARLSAYALRKGAKVLQPQVLILTYELPSINHLKLFGKVFTCPVASSYGTTESGYVFMQCEHGHLHQNTDSCHVDFVQVDGLDRSVGRIVVTTFNNPWRILVRFVTGDLGRLATQPCPCGRHEGLTLERIEGRETNITIGSGGRLIKDAMLDETLSVVEGLLDYQLTQSSPGEARCKVIPSGTVAPDALKAAIRKSLASLYDEPEVELVDSIAFSPSGKYKRIVV